MRRGICITGLSFNHAAMPCLMHRSATRWLLAGIAAVMPARVRGQDAASTRLRPVAPYVTALLGGANSQGECTGPYDTHCFPMKPLLVAVSGGVRVRLRYFGAAGDAWTTLGLEHVALPMMLSSNPTPNGWLATGRLGLGNWARVAVDGSTGKFAYGDTRGRMMRWGAQVQVEHVLAFGDVLEMRAVEVDGDPGSVPRPFRPRFLVFGAGVDW
jgi:hypothetical protein